MTNKSKKCKENGEKVLRYAIRKHHLGVASVAVASVLFFATGMVTIQADELGVPSSTETSLSDSSLTSSAQTSIGDSSPVSSVETSLSTPAPEVTEESTKELSLGVTQPETPTANYAGTVSFIGQWTDESREKKIQLLILQLLRTSWVTH